LELFDVSHLLFTFLKHLLKSLDLLSAISAGTTFSALTAGCGGTLKSETRERSRGLGKVREDLTCGGTLNETIQGVASLVLLIFVILVPSQHAIATFLVQKTLSTLPGCHSEFLLKENETLSIELGLLADTESAHQLINTLGFFALAGGNTGMINVLGDMNLVTSGDKS
jgi:hypothetical protein